MQEKVNDLRTIELLAPAGRLENAYAAVENGADALFVGGKAFNARQYADNFTDEELEEVIRYVKLRGIKIYITVNILIKDNELGELFRYLDYLSGLGVDAVISQDLAVVQLVKKYFPELTLHASTQMTAHSLEDVRFLETLGFKRMVLARELDLGEVKKITQHTSVQIETFIHGAMCYSYSGQCLISSLIGGRSGNRGRCAQPCRMKYHMMKNQQKIGEENYLLSLKDMCTIEFLPELVKAGIHSFKIEGRMKSPEYVAAVVKTYRKYLDCVMQDTAYQVTQEDSQILKEAFNRGGFSSGYYFEKPSAKMLTPISPRHMGIKIGEVLRYSPKTHQAVILLTGSLYPGDGIEIIRQGKESLGTGISKEFHKGETLYLEFSQYIEAGSEVYLTKNHHLLKALKKTYIKPQKKLPVTMKVQARIGEPIQIYLCTQKVNLTYTGEVLEQAQNNPVTEENAVKQLTKFGNTSFSLNKFDIQWDKNSYMPISKLNEMRRKALVRLEEKILEVPPRGLKSYQPIAKEGEVKHQVWCALVRTLDQLKACLREEEIKEIYWEWQYNQKISLEAYQLCQQNHKGFYLALPAIMHDAKYNSLHEALAYWESSDSRGYLIRNYGQFNLLKGSIKQKHMDYTLNSMNNEAIALWHELGASAVTLSMELTYSEIKSLKGPLEKIVYGHIPVMTSRQCLLKQQDQCLKNTPPSTYYLQDRKDVQWRIQTDCQGCIMQILTDQPMVFKGINELQHTAVKRLRFNFTIESEEETREILRVYLSKESSGFNAIKSISFKSIE